MSTVSVQSNFCICLERLPICASQDPSWGLLLSRVWRTGSVLHGYCTLYELECTHECVSREFLGKTTRQQCTHGRTDTLVIPFNHDIHTFSNVIMPLFEEVQRRQVLSEKFCFRDNFEGIKPNGCQEFELIVFIVWWISKGLFDIRGGHSLQGDL